MINVHTLGSSGGLANMEGEGLMTGGRPAHGERVNTGLSHLCLADPEVS